MDERAAGGAQPYQRFVEDLLALERAGRGLPLGGLAPRPPVDLAADAPVALVLAPHPDDECITGGLALRLLRESGVRVVAAPVTLGSKRERRGERLEELDRACAFLGFERAMVAPEALERIGPATKEKDPPRWRAAVQAVATLVADRRPRLVFFPHAEDWNSTHVGTHYLALEALSLQAPDLACLVLETEYWATMRTPNLLVQSGPADVADLVAAVSFYAGEVARNPFHLRLPAWMQDNVRRGGEVVGGQGGAVPSFDFATLYRVGRWQAGRYDPLPGPGRILPAGQDPLAALIAAG